MTKDEIISSGLLELYALGIASSEEILQVRLYLVQFPELIDELINIETSLESYALNQSLQPSSDVKQKILSQIAFQPIKKNTIAQIIPITRKIYRIPQLYRILMAVLLILLIESIILIYSFYHKYHTTLDNLQLANENIELREKSSEPMKSYFDLITNKNIWFINLSGDPTSSDGIAKLFWMKNTGEIYLDPSHLQQPSEGKQYQLWTFIDGKPIDAGLINWEQGSHSIQKMNTFPNIDSFAITIEKAGGNHSMNRNNLIVKGKK